MTTPETLETLYEICAYWAKIIMTKGENGTHIWVPGESARYRFSQFIEDKQLQKKLFGDNLPKLILIDGYEQEEIDYEDIRTQISESLGYTQTERNSALALWFEENPTRQIALFLMGFTNALRQNNTLILQRIATIPARHEMNNLKILFFTDMNIMTSESYDILLRSSNILQNIKFQPLFPAKDILQFTKFLSEQWGISVPDEIRKSFIDDIGGHFLLVKEAVRLFRDNPTITREEILTAPSLIRKGMAIFERLSDKDKKTIQHVLQADTSVPVSDFLMQTHLVQNNVIGLPYWNHIKVAIFASLSDTQSSPTAHSIDFYFTSTERDVFELLTEAKKIVSRETIAEKIWHKGWEDKYSDWAIDQLIHRIREKLKLTNSIYSIQTKKGQGFFITEKA